MNIRLSKVSPLARVVWVRRLVCLALVVGKVMSWKLWLFDRKYPLCPVWDSLPLLHHPADHLVAYATLLFLLLAGIFAKRSLFLWAYLGLDALNLIQDQTRWQPWVFEYLMLLLPTLYLSRNTDTEKAHRILRLQAFVLAAVYLFAGLQKLNPEFIPSIWQPIVANLFHIPSQNEGPWLPWGYAIPVLEIIGAVFLVLKPTRIWGVALFLVTHLFILYYLMPSGINYNSIVWPWNIALAVLIIPVFVNSGVQFFKQPILPKSADGLLPAFVLLLLILPAVNLFGYYETELSSNLFTGKSNNMLLMIKPEALPKIPQHLKRYVVNYQYVPQYNGPIISMQMWAMHEMNVSVISERRVFKQISRNYCRLGLSDSDIQFKLYKGLNYSHAADSILCSE